MSEKLRDSQIEALSKIADGLFQQMEDAQSKAKWAMMTTDFSGRSRNLLMTRDKYMGLAESLLKEITEIRTRIATG